MTEFTLTIGLADHGRANVAEANAGRLLDAVVSVNPRSEPVVDADFSSGLLNVTFGVDADNADEALEIGRPTLSAAAAASGLEPTEVVYIEVTPALADQASPLPA